MATLECREVLNKYCLWNRSTPKPFLHCHMFWLWGSVSNVSVFTAADLPARLSDTPIIPSKLKRCQLIVNQLSCECITWLTLCIAATSYFMSVTSEFVFLLYLAKAVFLFLEVFASLSQGHKMPVCHLISHLPVCTHSGLFFSFFLLITISCLCNHQTRKPSYLSSVTTLPQQKHSF